MDTPRIVRYMRQCQQQVIEALRYRLFHFGKVPLCNIQRHRAPCLGQFCFPLCWRCTSIIGTFLLCRYLLFPHVQIRSYQIYFVVMFCLAPTIIDGSVQYYYHKESTNRRRIVTGMLAGFGLFLLKRLHLP